MWHNLARPAPPPAAVTRTPPPRQMSAHTSRPSPFKQGMPAVRSSEGTVFKHKFAAALDAALVGGEVGAEAGPYAVCS